MAAPNQSRWRRIIAMAIAANAEGDPEPDHLPALPLAECLPNAINPLELK